MANISDARGIIEINKKLMNNKEVWDLVKKLMTSNSKNRNPYPYCAMLLNDMSDDENVYEFSGYGRWTMLNTLPLTFLWDVIQQEVHKDNPEAKNEEVVLRVKEVVNDIKSVIGDEEFFVARYKDYEPGGYYFVDMTVKAYLPEEHWFEQDRLPIALKMDIVNLKELEFTIDNIRDFEPEAEENTLENVERVVREAAPDGTSEERIAEIIEEIHEENDEYFLNYEASDYFY